jgi:hypothetical protein
MSLRALARSASRRASTSPNADLLKLQEHLVDLNLILLFQRRLQLLKKGQLFPTKLNLLFEQWPQVLMLLVGQHLRQFIRANLPIGNLLLHMFQSSLKDPRRAGLLRVRHGSRHGVHAIRPDWSDAPRRFARHNTRCP